MAEQQINSQIQTNNEELTNTITLHDIIRMVIANWYWFVLSTVCCLCAAYYYLASTPKIYSRTATILVKDSRKGGDVDLTAFSDLAGFQNRRNVDNEVFILQSRRLMTNVVKQLNLTVNYSVSDGLRRRDLYGQAPIDVKFINDNDNQSLAMEITPIDDDKIRLSEFKDQFVTKHESRSVITAAYGDTIPTPVGQVVVQKSLYMAPDYIGVPIRVTKSSLGRTTNAYRAAVKSDVANKQASVVTISMNNTVPRRAEDVINTLIEAYNEDAIEDKRRVSVATGKFIKARLDVIGRELGDVDRNIEDIKKDNRMVDITSEAARSVSESSRYKTEGLSLENQINVAEYIRTYLNDPKNVGELIPAMAAAGTNTAIAKQIEDYNSAILRREKLLENSSERSPVIQDLDNLLAAVRRSIISSLDSNISTLEIQRDAMRKEETQANIRISTMPSQEKVIPGHHAPAEDQGRTVPLPAEQAGGEPAQLRRGREQLTVDRLRLRQQRSRIAPTDDDSGHRPDRGSGHSLRPALPDRHARHDHPRSQGHRGQCQRPVPGRHPLPRGRRQGRDRGARNGPRRPVGGFPHSALEHDVYERLGRNRHPHHSLHLVGPARRQDLRGDEPWP